MVFNLKFKQAGPANSTTNKFHSYSFFYDLTGAYKHILITANAAYQIYSGFILGRYGMYHLYLGTSMLTAGSPPYFADVFLETIHVSTLGEGTR